MNEYQERADQRERAQLAIGILEDAGDPLYAISDDMIRLRQAYAAIAGGEDSPEVVQELMDAMASVTTVLDDILSEMYAVMEPEDIEEVRQEVTSVEGAVVQCGACKASMKPGTVCNTPFCPMLDVSLEAADGNSA